MLRILGILAFLGVILNHSLSAQEVMRYRTTVVALTDDPELRADFEASLVEKARQNNYDAISSIELVPDVADVNNRAFVDNLLSNSVQAVLMLRPAATGQGSSIESVRDDISPEMFERIREFAGEVSEAGPDDLLAVVHMAIYILDEDDGAVLVSAGAVWLDEPVDSQEVAVDRLQNLIVENVNSVRPAIRQHLGMPPLP